MVAREKVTAFRGFLVDTNGNPKGNLIASVFSGNTTTQVGPDQPATTDGFYFAPVPAGTYKVKIFDAANNQTLVQDQFGVVNFHRVTRRRHG